MVRWWVCSRAPSTERAATILQTRRSMSDAYIVDGVRTPIGSFAGSLAETRPDDMAALTIRRLLERHPTLDPARITGVIMGCANQAGEANGNVARMVLLLAGLICAAHDDI